MRGLCCILALPLRGFRAARRRPAETLAVGAVLALLAACGWWGGHRWAAARQVRLAREALARHDLAEARGRLVEALRHHPRDAEAHLLAARAARRSGDLPGAERHLRDCERLHGPADELTLERVLVRVQGGELTNLAPDLERRVERDDAHSALILEALAQGYMQSFRVPEALSAAERLLRRAPDHVPALLCRGWALEQLLRFNGALEMYRRAVALRPEDVWARLSLGEVLLFLKRVPEAAEQFEYLESVLPDNAAVRLGLARCRRGQGRTEAARRILDELAADHPEEPTILSERGQLALEEGQAAAAERWLRKAVEGAPSDRQARHALAQCLRQLGKDDEARQQQARFERIEADLKQLTELCREVSRPGSPPCLRCKVGLLYMRLGREPEGVRWLLGALQQDPRLPAAHQALADYYERSNQPALAERHHRLAVAP